MIQEIGNHVFHNEFRQLEATSDDLILCCRGVEVLVRLEGAKEQDNSGALYGGDLALPRRSDLVGGDGDLGLVYLVSVDATPLFLARTIPSELPKGFLWQSIRELRFARPRWLAFAAAVGFHLADWYRSNRFCGLCGHPTELVSTNREIVCPSCGHVVYPRINPAVIVGVLDPLHERLLLTNYAASHSRYANYALVAGFTEVGETFEETVTREVAEEVGLSVGRLRYWAGQPWPLTSSILVGFWCEVQGSTELTVDHHELSRATWLRRDEIPMPRRDTSSLTNAMISAFAQGYDPYRI